MRTPPKYRLANVAAAVAVVGSACATAETNDFLAIDVASKAASTDVSYCVESESVINRALSYIALFTTAANIAALGESEDGVISAGPRDVAGAGIDDAAMDFVDAAIGCGEDAEDLLAGLYTILNKNSVLTNGNVGAYSADRLESALARLNGETSDGPDLRVRDRLLTISLSPTERSIEPTNAGLMPVVNRSMPAPAPAFTVTLSQEKGPNGTRVTVTVAGAKPNTTFWVSVDGSGTNERTNAAGSSSSVVEMGGAVGDVKFVEVVFTSPAGVEQRVSKTFTITAPEPN